MSTVFSWKSVTKEMVTNAITKVTYVLIIFQILKHIFILFFTDILKNIFIEVELKPCS